MRSMAACAVLLILAGCGGSSPGTPSAPSASPAPTATPAAIATPVPSPTPATGPTVLRMASVRGANGHGASGTARIVREGESFRLELGEDFRIDSGNNDVYLTSGADTIRGSDLNLGNMQSLTGRQTYVLPDDGGRYGFVMLWCRPFRVPIGVGELR